MTASGKVLSEQIKSYPEEDITEAVKKNYQQVITEVNRMLQQKDRAIIAIDGKSAAGKTTAAEVLSGIWRAPVIHMDEFFLPLELRTESRYQEPGGNIHYERFLSEVIDNLKEQKNFTYQRFDCSCMDYSGCVKVKNHNVIIVEGAYSMHPIFGAYYDVPVFMNVSQEEQLRRLYLRNTNEQIETFQKQWIPLELNYINTFHINQRKNVIIIS